MLMTLLWTMASDTAKRHSGSFDAEVIGPLGLNHVSAESTVYEAQHLRIV